MNFRNSSGRMRVQDALELFAKTVLMPIIATLNTQSSEWSFSEEKSALVYKLFYGELHRNDKREIEQLCRVFGIKVRLAATTRVQDAKPNEFIEYVFEVMEIDSVNIIVQYMERWQNIAPKYVKFEIQEEV